jgi:hypothetical protein
MGAFGRFLKLMSKYLNTFFEAPNELTDHPTPSNS